MQNANDLAKNPGLDLHRLESFLDDIDYQPMWRDEADRAAQYYDGNQLPPNVVAEMKARGQPILIHNLIGPAIDGVLGLEEKTRTDWVVKPDNDEFVDLAEALNEELNEAARMANADKSRSDAFAGQVKTGLSWVEVTQSGDPYEPDFRTNYVHRREIYWDWHSKRPDLKDARWLLRKRWLDEDEAQLAFPKHKEMIKMAVNGWDSFDFDLYNESPELAGAYTDFTDSTRYHDEWRDSDRRMVMVYEVYYRVWNMQTVLKSPEGLVVPFDQQNKIHVALVNAGKVQIIKAPVSSMRLAYFVGPHRIADIPSPHPHNHFPYVPFWGFREDVTGVPYGLIRRMMPAQDEINNRRSKLTWLLNAKRIIKDEDAVLDMSDQELSDEVHRPDSVINLNPNRKNKDAFRVEVDFNIASQQFQVMQDAEQMIQQTAGIYNSFLGQTDGAKSGVAINSLVEQGTTTLSEIYGNYQFSSQLMGELLMANVVQKLSRIPNHKVMIGVNRPTKTKTVVLNEQQSDESGRTKISNDVTRIKTQVVLDDMANSAGYRQQVAARMMELVSSLPPEMQAAVMDIIVEMLDIPQKDELIKRIRQVSGQGQDPEDMTEEQIAEQQAQQEQQAKMMELQFGEMEAKLGKLQAEAREKNAKAVQAEQDAGMGSLEADKLVADTQMVYAQMKKVAAEVTTLKDEYLRNLDERIRLTRNQVDLRGNNRSAA